MTGGSRGEGSRGPSHLRLYGLISLMVFFWAMNFLIGKIALREFPPLLLAGLRVTLAGAMIAPVYAWRRRRNPDTAPWTRPEVIELLVLGFFGVALNQLAFVAGLGRTSVAHASILMATTPLLVLVITAVTGQERLRKWRLAGMALAVAGVALLTLAPSKRTGATPLGDFFVFLAALAFALFAVFGKHTTARHGSVTVNTFAYVGGALMLSPVTLWQAWGFSFAAVSWKGWVSYVYMALFPSLICYLIFYYALTHISASRVSAFSYLQPLLATSAAALLLAEPVTAKLVTGGALVLAGVYVTERA